MKNTKYKVHKKQLIGSDSIGQTIWICSVRLHPKMRFVFVAFSLGLSWLLCLCLQGAWHAVLLFVLQEKDAKAREQRENERLKKIREIREAEKKAASADSAANNAHWVCCCCCCCWWWWWWWWWWCL